MAKSKMQKRNKKGKTTVTVSESAETGDKLFPSLNVIRSKLVFGLQSKDKLPKVEQKRSIDEKKSHQNGSCEYTFAGNKPVTDDYVASPIATESSKRDKNVFEELYNLKNFSTFQSQNKSDNTMFKLKDKPSEGLVIKSPDAIGHVKTNSNANYLVVDNNNCKEKMPTLQADVGVCGAEISNLLTENLSATGAKVPTNKRTQESTCSAKLGNRTSVRHSQELSRQTGAQNGDTVCSETADGEQKEPVCQLTRKTTSNSIVKRQTVSHNGKHVPCKKLTVNLSQTNLEQKLAECMSNSSTVSVNHDAIRNVPIIRASTQSSKASSDSVGSMKGIAVGRVGCSAARRSSQWEINSVVTPVLQIATCARTDIASGKLFDLRGNGDPVRVESTRNEFSHGTRNINQGEASDNKRHKSGPFSCLKQSTTSEKASLNVESSTATGNEESPEKNSICRPSQVSEQKQMVVCVHKAVKQQDAVLETVETNTNNAQESISSTGAHNVTSPPNSPKRILLIRSPVKLDEVNVNVSQNSVCSEHDRKEISNRGDKSPKYDPFVKRTPVQKATVKPMQMIVRSPESSPLDLTVPRLVTIPLSPKRIYAKVQEKVKGDEKPLDLSVPRQEHCEIDENIACLKSSSLPVHAIKHASAVSQGSYTCLVPVSATELGPSTVTVGVENGVSLSSTLCSSVWTQKERVLDSEVAPLPLGSSNVDRVSCINQSAHLPVDDSTIQIPDIKFAALKAAQVQEKLKSTSLQGGLPTVQTKTNNDSDHNTSVNGESPPKLTAVTPPDKRNLSIVKPLTTPPHLSPHSSPPALAPVKQVNLSTTSCSESASHLSSKVLHQTPTEIIRQYSAFLPTVNYKRLAAPLRVLPSEEVLRFEYTNDMCHTPKWDITATKYYQANIATKHPVLQMRESRQYMSVQDKYCKSPLKGKLQSRKDCKSEMEYRVKVLKMPPKLAISMCTNPGSECEGVTNGTFANGNELGGTILTPLDKILSEINQHDDDKGGEESEIIADVTPEFADYRRTVLRLPEKLVFRKTSRNLTPFMQSNRNKSLYCGAIPNTALGRTNAAELNYIAEPPLDVDDPNSAGDLMCNKADNGKNQTCSSKDERQRSPQKKVIGDNMDLASNGTHNGSLSGKRNTNGPSDSVIDSHTKLQNIQEKEDVSPDSKDKKCKKRRSLLDELSSSDGYIAEKRFRQNDTLLTDPSMLSREERALQRAMIQFSEMESRRMQNKENNTSSKTPQATLGTVEHERKVGSVNPRNGNIDHGAERLKVKQESKKKKVPTATLR